MVYSTLESFQLNKKDLRLLTGVGDSLCIPG